MPDLTTIPNSRHDLLQTEVAVLSTVGPDGFPQTTAVGFLYDDGKIRMSLNTARQKTKNMRRNPKVNFFVLDLKNPMRYLEVRARADVSPDPDYAFADKLGKHHGVDLRQFNRAGGSRVVVTLEPVKVNAGT